MELEHPASYTSIRIAEKHESFLNDAEIAQNALAIENDVNNVLNILTIRLNHPEGAVSADQEEIFNEAAARLQTNIGLDAGPYVELTRRYKLGFEERVMLILSMLPHFAPERLMQAMSGYVRGIVVAHSGAGGFITQETHRFIPTLSTVFFICSGYDKALFTRSFLNAILNGSLVREQIIRLKTPGRSESSYSDLDLIPVLATEYLHHLLYGREVRPDFGDDFPARKITAEIDVKRQLILPVHTAREVGLLQHAIHSVEESLKQGKKVKGMPALFFGPPGTGKTLTATALGQLTGRPVFKIDLAQVVSKYVGETEKRLANVFDRADGKNWILFFDEADSLFAKRTGVGDAHDRYANLLTAYLLQRMEDYAGISILSTNYRQNLDQAMTRRFVQIIRFPEPQHKERDQIWQTALPEGFEYEAGLNTKTLAQAELTGANIAMILKLCMLHAVSRKTTIITANDIKYWSIQEFAKSGISPKMRSWPNEKLRGFNKAKPLTDPLYPEQVLHVAEYENFANINLFEE